VSDFLRTLAVTRGKAYMILHERWLDPPGAVQLNLHTYWPIHFFAHLLCGISSWARADRWS